MPAQLLSRSRRTLFAGLLVLLFVAAGGRLTSAAAMEADSFVRQVGTETLVTLGDRTLTAARRENVVRQLLTNHLDMEAVARFCLGRYSRGLNEAQAKEYAALFEDYLVKVYSALLAQYNGETLVVHEGTRESDGFTLVTSQINRPSGPPIRVEWKVVDKSGEAKVTDVIVEGVSMAFTQRQQFESVIQNNGGRITALFDAMRKQIAR